jgi:ABC-type dipeptide/oligopeptide/nickel transport system ATPase component
VGGKPILRGIDLAVAAGEVHAIMGPNGWGKSTLAHVLAGRESYAVTGGEVRYRGRDLLAMAPEERAREGVFLAFQYPVEIPGVANVYLLKAILPLRGKVLNAEQASTDKVAGNKELQDIVSALGCGIGSDFDISKLRYGRIFLLMDADSDGHHIATLLLTFFYRHLRKLIESGVVHIAQPPLYRVDIGKETYWALDEAHRDQIIQEKAKGNAKPNIMRFKGLGEMTADELKQTTLDPKHRLSLQVTIDNPLETDRVINDLLGKDVSARFKFIMERAGEVQELDV